MGAASKTQALSYRRCDPHADKGTRAIAKHDRIEVARPHCAFVQQGGNHRQQDFRMLAGFDDVAPDDADEEL